MCLGMIGGKITSIFVVYDNRSLDTWTQWTGHLFIVKSEQDVERLLVGIKRL